MSNLWLLPDGIEELMPDDAMRLESLRRTLIDLCFGHGYELVSPSLLEHLDSLLSGGGKDLELETFKLTDHTSGRQLGIRADMTPQIARIDAHLLNADQPSRLCYSGPVLRARPKQAFESRELFQLGAELYGSEDVRADVEIIELMMRCLDAVSVGSLHLDLGHVGVFRSLTSLAGLDDNAVADLFDALQRKSVPDLGDLVGKLPLPPKVADALILLPTMRGEMPSFENVVAPLRGVDSGVDSALDNLKALMALVHSRLDQAVLNFDLAELRGYHYHTGVVFSAFCDGLGRDIARGGRYDAIGSVYGRSRPATGFSLDLRQVLKLQSGIPGARHCILAPPISDDPALDQVIDQLREKGERVVRRLASDSAGSDGRCHRRELVYVGGQWIIKDNEPGKTDE